MAATKAQIHRHVADFLARQLGQRQEAGAFFTLRGPHAGLRVCFLVLTWVVLTVLVLESWVAPPAWAALTVAVTRLWKFRFVALTREAVVVVTISKFTLAPRKVESVTPRDQARVTDLHHGTVWTRFSLTDASGATHRHNAGRPRWRDLDALLAALGAPPRPRRPSEPTTASHGRHSAPH